MSNKSITAKVLKSKLSGLVADKTILWLSDHNKYLVVIQPFDEILQRVYCGKPDLQIIEYCINDLGFDSVEANQVLSDIKNTLEIELTKEKTLGNKVDCQPVKVPVKLLFNHFYKINGLIFFIEYETADLEYLIHPKLAHLEILETVDYIHYFQIFNTDSRCWLVIDGGIIGNWTSEMEHYLSGKVSMEILQKITHTNESDWMAVFHAAGISYNNQGVLFLGDSGNGKSTLSAILMANGFEVLADDFLPVLSGTTELFSFPAAISIKKHAIDLLAAQFPELKLAKEYEFPALNKTVRYLSNPFAATENFKKVPCKALVFVKYEAGSKLKFNAMPKDIAFQKLIPDSWISPLEKNAKQFLDWFEKLPCWELTYADNKSMVETVKKIFNDEL